MRLAISFMLAMGLLATAAGPAVGQQGQGSGVDYPGPKQQPVRPKDVLQSVLGNLSPRPIGPDWDRPADLLLLATQGALGRKLSIMAGGTPASVTRDMRLYHGQPGASIVAEFPFRVVAPGVNRLTFDCELIDLHLPNGVTINVAARNPPITLGAARRTFTIPGPGNGLVRIAFKPFAPLAAPQPGHVHAAACRMEAAGTYQGRTWRSMSSLAEDFRLDNTVSKIYLVDDLTGQLVLPAEDAPNSGVLGYAMPREWVESLRQSGLARPIIPAGLTSVKY